MATPGKPNEPLPEPDLSSPSRATNIVRILEARSELDKVVDVAKGNVVQQDLADAWLAKLAAKDSYDLPAEPLQRWFALFADEIDAVQRAANTIVANQPISDDNLAAAAQIGEKVLQLARQASEMSK